MMSDPSDTENWHPKAKNPSAVSDSGDLLKKGDDIHNSRKEKIGDYLSSLTTGKNSNYGQQGRNEYPVSVPTPIAAEFSIKNPDGSPAPLSDPSSNQQDSFTHRRDAIMSEAKAYFSAISSGGAPDAAGGGFFTENDLEAIDLDKNAQTRGHSLLSEIPENVDDQRPGNSLLSYEMTQGGEAKHANDTTETISRVLKVNRFTAGKRFAAQSRPQKDLYKIDNHRELGVYEKNNEKVLGLTEQQLAKIGDSLMLKAVDDGGSIEKPADVTKISGNATLDNNLDFKEQIAAVFTGQGGSVPGGAKKVEVENLRAINADGSYKHMSGNDKKIAKTQYNDKSFGNLNSYLEPFGGPFPVAMISIALSNAITALVVGVVVAAIVDLLMLPIVFTQSPIAPASSASSYFLGVRRGIKPNNPKGIVGTALSDVSEAILGWLGIQKPLAIMSSKGGSIIPFIKAVFFGSMQFFMPMITNFTAGGWFAVVTRQAIRDASEIHDAAGQGGGGLMGAVEGMLKLVDAFKKSKIFRFIILLANLGDITVASGGLTGNGPLYFPENRKPLKKIKPGHPGGRLIGHRGSLNNRATPSMYLLPESINIVGKRLDVLGLNHGLDYSNLKLSPGQFGQKKLMNPASSEGMASRFSPEQVEYIEDLLESEYIPFYFQDLRTNEIISFHAFLSQFSDNFQPKWSSSTGWGRMDEVHNYSTTTRSIQVTFWVMAMNKADMSEVYWKINKMLTLIYPQYSEGSLINTSDGKATFIQPFSQVPTASPVLRCRIGDIVKSNYSEQNVARLFGLHRKDFQLDGPPGEEYDAAIASKAAQYTDHLGHSDAMYEYRTSGQITMGGGAIVCVNAPSVNYKADPSDITTDWEGNPVASIEPFAPVGAVIETYLDDGYRFKYHKLLNPPLMGLAAQMVPMTQAFTQGFGKHSFIVGGYKMGKNVGKGVDADNWNFPTMYIIPTDETKAMASYKKVLQNEGNVAIEVRADYLSTATYAPGVAEALARGELGDSPKEKSTKEETTAMGKFFSAEHNPIIKSFKTTAGRGVACVIDSFGIDFHLNEVMWDTEAGKKAPMGAEISLGLKIIHDIAPGIDHDGFNRAPVYGVGDLSDAVQGDPWQPHGDWQKRRAAADVKRRGAWSDEGEQEKEGKPGKFK